MLREQMTLAPGTVVQSDHDATYIVEEVLGTGGFSAVYRVKEQKTQHIFALKELVDPDKEDRRKLTIEADLLKRLEHPSLPRVYDFFEQETSRRTYLVMDYIDGTNLETLRLRQADHRYRLATVVEQMAPIISAISYLHRQKPPVIHRDIKPANIILLSDNSDALLVDFGLAKEYDSDKTTSVFRYGTPGYAAPEQYRHGTSQRTDIYGMGATIYALLTGEVPIDALTRSVSLPEGDPLKRADEVCLNIPQSAGRVLERAMSLQAERRFATIDEFWKAFCDAAAHPEQVVAETGPLVSVWGSAGNEDIAGGVEARGKGTSATAQAGRSSSHPRRGPLFPVIISVLMVLVFVSIALYWARGSSETAALRSKGTVQDTSAIQRAHQAPVTNVCAVQSIQALPTSPYPLLSPCYRGTIDDIGVAREKSALYLTAIKQNKGAISGDFQGLGVTGVFKGTISSGGNINFTVKPNGRSDTLQFSGESKYGGDLKGNFQALDKNGRATLDEYGLWYVQPDNGSTTLTS